MLLVDFNKFILTRLSSKIVSQAVTYLNKMGKRRKNMQIFFFFMNGNAEWAQCALSQVCIPKKRKRKAVKRLKQIYKISKRVKKKKKKKTVHFSPKGGRGKKYMKKINSQSSWSRFE